MMKFYRILHFLLSFPSLFFFFFLKIKSYIYIYSNAFHVTINFLNVDINIGWKYSLEISPILPFSKLQI